MKKKWKLVCAVAIMIYISLLYTYFVLKTDDEWFKLETVSDFYQCKNQQVLPNQNVGAIAVNNADIVFVSDMNLGVRAFNASDPLNWQELGSTDQNYYYITKFVLKDQFLFLTQYTNLIILNISNPQNLTEVANYSTFEILQDVEIYESYAIIIGYQMLRVLDINNITNIYETEQSVFKYGRHDLSIWENYLYIADDTQGVSIYQIQENGILEYQSQFENYGPSEDDMLVERATRVTATEDFLFIADRWHGLIICDRSDPINPTVLSYQVASNGFTIAFDGRFVVVADNYDGIRIIDLIDPVNPQEMILDHSQGDCFDVVCLDGNIYTLVMEGAGIFRIVPASGINPLLLHEAIDFITGVVGITISIAFVIFVGYKTKNSQILV